MGFAKFFHLIAVVHFYYAFYYDRKYVTEPDNEWRKFSFGGRLTYLTIWNVLFQAIYYTFALLNDFLGSNDPAPKNRPLFRKIRDYLFATYAFPFAMNVGLTFWVLMSIDRALILPKETEPFFPSWLNHAVHTNIMIFIFIELFVFLHNYPSRRSSFIGIFIVMATYVGWVFCIKANSGYWVYPVLQVLNWPQRIAFIAFSSSVPFMLYFIGSNLNSMRWGSVAELPSSQKKKKQK